MPNQLCGFISRRIRNVFICNLYLSRKTTFQKRRVWQKQKEGTPSRLSIHLWQNMVWKIWNMRRLFSDSSLDLASMDSLATNKVTATSHFGCRHPVEVRRLKKDTAPFVMFSTCPWRIKCTGELFGQAKDKNDTFCHKEPFACEQRPTKYSNYEIASFKATTPWAKTRTKISILFASEKTAKGCKIFTFCLQHAEPKGVSAKSVLVLPQATLCSKSLWPCTETTGKSLLLHSK